MGMDFYRLEESAERISNLLGEQITPQNLLDYGTQDQSDLVFSAVVLKNVGMITPRSESWAHPIVALPSH
jgi:hypothetical protein